MQLLQKYDAVENYEIQLYIYVCWFYNFDCMISNIGI
jgi:hypothetical protein